MLHRLPVPTTTPQAHPILAYSAAPTIAALGRFVFGLRHVLASGLTMVLAGATNGVGQLSTLLIQTTSGSSTTDGMGRLQNVNADIAAKEAFIHAIAFFKAIYPALRKALGRHMKKPPPSHEELVACVVGTVGLPGTDVVGCSFGAAAFAALMHHFCGIPMKGKIATGVIEASGKVK